MKLKTIGKQCLLICLGICLGLAATIFWSRYRVTSLLKKNQENISEGRIYLRQFKEDIQSLEKSGPFNKLSRSNDAGVILNSMAPLVSLINQEHKELEADTYLGINRETWKILDNWDWKTELLQVNLNDPQLDWIEKLEVYDHWNIYKHRFYLEGAKRIRNLSYRGRLDHVKELLPIPDYFHIKKAADLYLYRELRSKDPKKGLQNYRHLAEIIFSADMIGSMWAIKMLETEQYMTEKVQYKDWHSVDEKTRETLKRVVFTWKDYLSPLTLNEFYVEIRSYLDRSLIYCNGNSTNIPIELVAIKYLNSPIPFEKKVFDKDLTQIYKYMSERCGQSLLHDAFLTEHSEIFDWPGVRSAIGANLLSEFTSGNFKLYREVK